MLYICALSGSNDYKTLLEKLNSACLPAQSFGLFTFKKYMNCKNCLFWKQKVNEPEMGICFKANKGKKNPPNSPISSLNKGIVIRYPELNEAPLVEVLFGENYGCIHFIDNI